MRKDLSKLDSATQEAIGEFTDPNKPTYPRDKKTVTSSGHVWELDDTLGKETINLRHGPTGSYFKMMPNGDIQIHSPTNNVNIIAAKNVEIKTGALVDTQQKDRSNRFDINIVGNAHYLIEGDTHLHTKGDRYDKVDGSYFLTVGNKTNIVSPDVGILSQGTFQLEVNEMKTDGQKLTTSVGVGGEVRYDLFGAFTVNQLLPAAGTISFTTLGNFEVNVGQNVNYAVGDSVDFQIGGVGFGPLKPAFTVNCAFGGISMNALFGASNFFAGGPALDIDCITGVYLN